MFGKRWSEYFAFQKVALVLILAVGLVRLGLSLAGLPNATVTWASMNVVLWAATFYAGVAVHTKGFGSYKQLLPLVFVLLIPFHGVAVLGILLSLAGYPNILAAPEYSGPAASSQWLHLAAHLTVGMVVPSLLLWGVASLTLRITKAFAARPAAA